MSRARGGVHQPVAIVRRFDSQCGTVAIDGAGLARPKVAEPMGIAKAESDGAE